MHIHAAGLKLLRIETLCLKTHSPATHIRLHIIFHTGASSEEVWFTWLLAHKLGQHVLAAQKKACLAKAVTVLTG